MPGDPTQRHGHARRGLPLGHSRATSCTTATASRLPPTSRIRPRPRVPARPRSCCSTSAWSFDCQQFAPGVQPRRPADFHHGPGGDQALRFPRSRRSTANIPVYIGSNSRRWMSANAIIAAIKSSGLAAITPVADSTGSRVEVIGAAKGSVTKGSWITTEVNLGNTGIEFLQDDGHPGRNEAGRCHQRGLRCQWRRCR